MRYSSAFVETSKYAEAVTSQEPCVGADAVCFTVSPAAGFTAGAAARFIVGAATRSTVGVAARSTVSAATRSSLNAATRSIFGAHARAGIGVKIYFTVGVAARSITGAHTICADTLSCSNSFVAKFADFSAIVDDDARACVYAESSADDFGDPFAVYFAESFFASRVDASSET